MDINGFKEFLEKKAWSRETSAHPDEWSEDNPALGQCLVTALVIQDYFGGEILHARNKSPMFAHYWNKLADGTEIDLTRSQFSEDIIIPEGKIRPREIIDQSLKVLPDIARRYQILKTKLEELEKQKVVI